MLGSSPSHRDYKPRPPQPGPEPGLVRGLLIGLGVGLFVALVIWVNGRRPPAIPDAATGPAAAAPAASEPAAAPTRKAPAARQESGVVDDDLSFYDTLPNNRVVLLERERATTNPPPPPIQRAGCYVLQAGSFSNPAEAEALRQRLLRMGLDASIQKLVEDDGTWHRVRVGPVADLARLNRWREQLRRAGIDAIAVRLGD